MKSFTSKCYNIIKSFDHNRIVKSKLLPLMIPMYSVLETSCSRIEMCYFTNSNPVHSGLLYWIGTSLITRSCNSMHAITYSNNLSNQYRTLRARYDDITHFTCVTIKGADNSKNHPNLSIPDVPCLFHKNIYNEPYFFLSKYSISIDISVNGLIETRTAKLTCFTNYDIQKSGMLDWLVDNIGIVESDCDLETTLDKQIIGRVAHIENAYRVETSCNSHIAIFNKLEWCNNKKMK